ncbi:transglutaminase domain-containing protein [Bacteroides sp. GM023]|uniref:transglutaminase domain-containing protein n=1 Tax=Bacteroides sp. GM023 TaxID=2723058 RepID=UPI00168A4911|nr:transglutaminase domain-containing protein [Bacteroides sp. GM023]MBD3589314.1 transglutaminase domain-containing protein [Bacteroides sp. GM023]
MIKHLLYIQLIIIVVLGWYLVDKVAFREESMTSLEAILQVAKDNRMELEKVLYCYQKNSTDSLKYRAACFLIENMPFYTYSDGEQLDNYKSYYIWLKKSRGKTPQQVADSVKNVYGAINELEKRCDIMEIDSAYLCHNIDWAFKVWQEQPWGKNISFETFCEYLLPYRIGDEPLTYWREIYYEKYNSLLDSLRMSDSLDIEDPVVAANYLISKLPDKSYYYTSVTPYPFGHIGPEYVQYLSGTCREVTDFAMYLFRALGIPCAIDFVPVRSYINAGHFWLTTWNKDGEEYMTDFPQKLRPVRKNWWYRWDDSSKVYRYTFSVNGELYEQIAKYGEDIYPFWSLPKFMDVTHEYGYNFKKELVIPLEKQYKTKRSGKIAYLCVSDRDRWTPVDWTEYNAGCLSFQYVRNGSFMRVASYENGALCFLTDPFYVDKQNGEICYYPAGKEKEDVILYAKCDIGRENMYRDRMIGGVFEGSNHPNFSQKDTLFIIQGRPGRLNTTVKSYSDKAYRYLRYFGPPKSACNISEVAFYEKDDTVALSGKIIGTPGCYQHDGTHEYTNVFDGKTWTSFDYFEATGGWAGLDLGRKICVDRIVYTPRNRDNYVRPDDVYELFYCDRDWKSAGKIKATADSLVFRDIPVNTVLLLRNHTRGLDERIFIYENGTQLWK